MAAHVSIGHEAWDERIIGTAARAAARATAASASRCAISSTPTGASTMGAGRRSPNKSIDGSRTDTSRSTRGTIAQRSNAARFARSVSSAPAPPAT